MKSGNLHSCAGVVSAALLALSAVVPLDTASAQSPRQTAGPHGVKSFATTTSSGIIAPTSNPELVFEPIQPCRAFNTAGTNGGGPIPANTTRSFYVSGTTGFSSQGGPSAGCGVPASAAAVAISLTAPGTGNTTAGRITAFPYGATPPTAVALSFTPNVNQTASVMLGINQSQISLLPKVGSVQVTGDITGYFAPQMQAYVQSDGSVYSGTTRIISSSHVGTGQYEVVVDRDVYTCSTAITPASSSPLIATGYGDKNNTIDIFIYSMSNGAFALTDADFNVMEFC